MTAVPADGCQFEQWSGDIDDNQANSSSIVVIMDKERTIFADFAGCPGPLEITVASDLYYYGSNAINASFGSVSWTASGPTVNIAASAFEGYRFDAWTGAINSSQKTISFTPNSSESITARFSNVVPFPWYWVVIGVAAIVLVFAGIVIYRFIAGRKKRPQVIPIDVTSPPPPTPPQSV